MNLTIFVCQSLSCLLSPSHLSSQCYNYELGKILKNGLGKALKQGPWFMLLQQWPQMSLLPLIPFTFVSSLVALLPTPYMMWHEEHLWNLVYSKEYTFIILFMIKYIAPFLISTLIRQCNFLYYYIWIALHYFGSQWRTSTHSTGTPNIPKTNSHILQSFSISF